MARLKFGLAWLAMAAAILACSLNPVQIVDPNSVPPPATGNNSAPPANNSSGSGSPANNPNAETGRVVRVVDGDTIDVNINGEVVRVRYLGMNTTETNRGEDCSQEGKNANAALVDGQTVTLVPDRDPQDQYDRELRYIYVGNVFVNAELVRQGWAEAVMYEPNDAHWQELIALEQEAARARRGCHGISDIFDDGRYDR